MQIITYSTTNLVKRHRGTMPVILTCPHDGSESPSGVPERTEAANPANCSFSTARDSQTALITESVAQKILDLSGVSPYTVIAKFHRRFVDVNRTARCAFTDSSAAPFYEEYHEKIDRYVTQILEQNQNRGFLFDIHGTGVLDIDPADIFLGTANGQTLLPTFDRNLIFQQHGLHGLLTWARHSSGLIYKVSPIDSVTTETANRDGGFTVKEYGTRINSISIEIATPIKGNEENRNLFIEDLAFSIINFVRRYAPF